MHYRRLGKSKLKVSALCVGSMMFGDQTELAEAGNTLASARALELAINAEEEAMVDALLPPGHASRPGYSDPLHPFFERVLARAM